MKKLFECKKITLQTLKSFAARNADALFYREISCFDVMTDGVRQTHGKWQKTTVKPEKRHEIAGCFLLGSSCDYFSLYQDDNFVGIEVYNSCGSSILAVEKIDWGGLLA